MDARKDQRLKTIIIIIIIIIIHNSVHLNWASGNEDQTLECTIHNKPMQQHFVGKTVWKHSFLDLFFPTWHVCKVANLQRTLTTLKKGYCIVIVTNDSDNNNDNFFDNRTYFIDNNAFPIYNQFTKKSYSVKTLFTIPFVSKNTFHFNENNPFRFKEKTIFKVNCILTKKITKKGEIT